MHIVLKSPPKKNLYSQLEVGDVFSFVNSPGYVCMKTDTGYCILCTNKTRATGVGWVYQYGWGVEPGVEFLGRFEIE